MESKVCTRCKEVKCVNDFPKDSRLRSGHRAICKICVRKQRIEWYKANSEKAKAYSRAYRKINPEKVKACNIKWWKANPHKRYATKKCEHGKIACLCTECGGASTCEHHRIRSECKTCGLHRKFLNRGFTVDQIKKMGNVIVCQFPDCLIQANNRQLHSDHVHDGNRISPENYRGELCLGHNILLADLDRHPEQANAKALEYMSRRPYAGVAESI